MDFDSFLKATLKITNKLKTEGKYQNWYYSWKIVLVLLQEWLYLEVLVALLLHN